MRHLGLGLASALVAVSLTFGGADPAAARDIEWCAIDPIVNVLGAQFRLATRIAAPASSVTSVSYVLHLPSNAEGTVSMGVAQGPIAQTVEVRYDQPAASGRNGSFRVSVEVTANATDRVAMAIDVSGRSVTSETFEGSTNRTLHLKFYVAAD
jgi:hypothetical protein